MYLTFVVFSDECSVPTISNYLFYSHLFTENSKAKVKYKLEIWLQTPSQSGIDKINTDEKEKKKRSGNTTVLFEPTEFHVQITYNEKEFIY
jgi:hypothetical protein